MNGQGPLTLSALTHFHLCVFKCLAIPAPGVKEDAEDSPLSQALYHCFQRLDKDCSRDNITTEERLRLREKAQELYHTARTKPGISYEAFNASLSAAELYPLCGVQRKSRPRGRPKRGT